MDVSTVAFNRNLDNPPKVENINVTFYTFVGLGYYVIGIADKSLRYYIDNPYWYDSKYIATDYLLKLITRTQKLLICLIDLNVV